MQFADAKESADNVKYNFLKAALYFRKDLHQNTGARIRKKSILLSEIKLHTTYGNCTPALFLLTLLLVTISLFKRKTLASFGVGHNVCILQLLHLLAESSIAAG